MAEVWWEDALTGESTERPGGRKSLADRRAGEVKARAVWRPDRLGRTAKGLTTLLDELVTLKVNVVSLKGGIDLATPADRQRARQCGQLRDG